MTETWTSKVTGTHEVATVSGRVKVSLIKKISVIWWFGNDPEPKPPNWYLPDKALWWRYVCWYCRNPLVNFNDYVIGVCDRNYSVSGPWPVNVPDWLDSRRTGFKWSIIWTALPRPFLSYTGNPSHFIGSRRLLWHIGWEPGGSFAIKFNLTNDWPAA